MALEEHGFSAEVVSDLDAARQFAADKPTDCEAAMVSLFLVRRRHHADGCGFPRY